MLPLRSSATGAEGVQALPRSLLLNLPLGEEELISGAAVMLDEAHVAVVGFPHPSVGHCKGDAPSLILIFQLILWGCAILSLYILIMKADVIGHVTHFAKKIKTIPSRVHHCVMWSSIKG